MLDGLSISHRSGLILWSKSYAAPSTGGQSTTQPLNSLVQEVLLSSSSASHEGEADRYDKDSQSLMWTLANDLGLIFVVVWPRILHLSYLEKLLESMKTLFCNMYGDLARSVTSGNAAGVDLPEDGDWSKLWKGWDSIVTKLVKELEAEAAKQSRRQGTKAANSTVGSGNGVTDSASLSESEAAATTPTVSPGPANDAEAIARNIAALKARNKGRLSPSPRGVAVKKGKGGVSSASEASDSEAVPKRTSTPGKAARKWEDSGNVSDKDMATLDFSSQDLESELEQSNLDALVDEKGLGRRGENGLYEVADYADNSGEDEDGILASLTAAKLSTSAQQQKPPQSAFSSFFSKLSTTAGLSSKTLTEADLRPVLNAMREHLMKKNVARDIADKICDTVGQSLVGKKTSGFGDGGVTAEVRRALEEALTRVLTSKTSTDILLDISRKKQVSRATSSNGDAPRTPYVITFVGVNGVGKSTNLSKVAFWLLQNNLKVLIAACDTFRSGAVEQLRVHVRNLGKLKVLQESGATSSIELYERGYGKDAAGIAKDAISYATTSGFDVVLIDTAGRMQDNEPLMRALAKLVAVNSPDKIFFVGEAVVGNEAVDQLTKFNRSLKDFSGVSNAKARGIDGMILTKMDIIDDKVGAALSMTYVTGQPIVFIGTGQTYTDLRAMKVSHVVNALMRN